MESIIVISPRNDEEKNIIGQWEGRAVFCGLVSDNRVTLETEKGHIFIDFGDDEEIRSEYADEAVDFDIGNKYFYVISYSDRDFVADFLKKTKFADGCLFDNDRGEITDYSNLIKQDFAF